MVRTKKQIVEQIAKKKEQENETEKGPIFLIHPPPSPSPTNTHQTIVMSPPRDMPQKISPTLLGESPQMWASVQKLQSTFTNLTLQEINEMLIDCAYNEEEVILRLITQANYLISIRQRIEKKSVRPIKKRPIMAKEQIETTPAHSVPITLPTSPIPTPVLPPSLPLMDPVPEEKKKQQRSATSRIITGRLALDDALKQVQDCRNDDRAAFDGWSDARLRAYKMIDKNPNSYYYRFNAPGEQQKKGKWSDEENALFLSRLAELGANSQWGVFSIAIPGRVGYQCSNYYRFLIESGQLQDPNYVIDTSGKARYLFDKKADDGSIEKIFRKHSKHGSMAVPTIKKSKRKQKEEDDDDDPSFSIKKSYKKKPDYRMTRQRYQEELKRGQHV